MTTLCPVQSRVGLMRDVDAELMNALEQVV